jgi:hypothetical protein
VRRWLIDHGLGFGSGRRAAAAACLVAALPFGVGAARAGLRSLSGPESVDEVSETRGPLVLPVIASRFNGVTLDQYLRPPAVAPHHMDALLTSSVLRDADFARDVHWWVDYWTISATRWFPGFLSRMAAGSDAIDSALVSYGFPASLRYLPLIESGYDPRVTSQVGAVGLWQLMPVTARGLGLEVSALTDERRHPEKSTEAALRYLDDLHGEFGSWFVTLAAYNTGPTRVRSILRRHAPSEPVSDSLFWALRQHFPRETREFVPKLYGAMWVASRPDAYGYGGPVDGP